MSTWEERFLVFVRVVFIFAYGAFLWASIHHVAAYFSNFEPAGTGEAGPFALAVAVDGTALVLAIGMMFFGRGMPWYAKLIVWAFIILLTGFSWLVNWQYAVINESTTISTKLPVIWQNLNPILASSFAFLNLAYSIVAEFFNTKKKTATELQAELDDLNSTAELKKQINEKKSELKGTSIIEQAKQKALEVKNAAAEVLKKEQEPEKQNTPPPMEDKLQIALEELQNNTEITDEALADILNLKRPASARFWRLKAVEILQNGSLFSTQIANVTGDVTEQDNGPVSEQETEIDTEPLPNSEENTTESDSEDDNETDTEPDLPVFTTSQASQRSHARKKLPNLKKRGNGLLLIQKELAKNPTISNAAICKKTGLSASYVSAKRTELQKKETAAV